MSCQNFRKNHPGCTECNHNRIINASENRSKYSLNNPHQKEVCKIKVDNCLEKESSSKQCDYLFLSCNTLRAFFIELKGKDLTHAIQQLDQSIDNLSPSIEEFAINARVVLSKTQTPDLRTTKYKKFVTKVKRLGGTFVHKNKILTETLD